MLKIIIIKPDLLTSSNSLVDGFDYNALFFFWETHTKYVLVVIIINGKRTREGRRTGPKVRRTVAS